MSWKIKLPERENIKYGCIALDHTCPGRAFILVGVHGIEVWDIDAKKECVRAMSHEEGHNHTYEVQFCVVNGKNALLVHDVCFQYVLALLDAESGKRIATYDLSTAPDAPLKIIMQAYVHAPVGPKSHALLYAVGIPNGNYYSNTTGLHEWELEVKGDGDKTYAPLSTNDQGGIKRFGVSDKWIAFTTKSDGFNAKIVGCDTKLTNSDVHVVKWWKDCNSAWKFHPTDCDYVRYQFYNDNFAVIIVTPSDVKLLIYEYKASKWELSKSEEFIVYTDPQVENADLGGCCAYSFDVSPDLRRIVVMDRTRKFLACFIRAV